MSVSATRPAPVSPPTFEEHVHDRSCWWDVTACRWAGPAHPVLTDPRVPEPRSANE